MFHFIGVGWYNLVVIVVTLFSSSISFFLLVMLCSTQFLYSALYLIQHGHGVTLSLIQLGHGVAIISGSYKIGSTNSYFLTTTTLTLTQYMSFSSLSTPLKSVRPSPSVILAISNFNI